MRMALKPSYQMPDGPALELGNTVITALTSNGHFATPQPPVATLQTAADAYKDSLSKARYGSREDRSKKNADKKTLIGLLREECDYVNMVAQGDEVMLASCGFPLSKDRQPKVLGTPEAKVELGEEGELILFTAAVPGAVAYTHQYKTQEEGATWSDITQSAAKCTIKDLQPGTVYSLRIVAIGTNGQVTMSNVINKRAS